MQIIFFLIFLFVLCYIGAGVIGVSTFFFDLHEDRREVGKKAMISKVIAIILAVVGGLFCATPVLYFLFLRVLNGIDDEDNIGNKFKATGTEIVREEDGSFVYENKAYIRLDDMNEKWGYYEVNDGAFCLELIDYHLEFNTGERTISDIIALKLPESLEKRLVELDE